MNLSICCFKVADVKTDDVRSNHSLGLLKITRLYPGWEFRSETVTSLSHVNSQLRVTLSR